MTPWQSSMRNRTRMLLPFCGVAGKRRKNGVAIEETSKMTAGKTDLNDKTISINNYRYSDFIFHKAVPQPYNDTRK